ncbi:hypothetical protein FZ103_17390 [Streptomonospora sp. PA3]|uniref:pilin n=1 Tax=Streptomonospora sp. PA3 TaxID=2607326 RepID=UPI0012DDDCD7|nr:pilin [Streptomonospora sp. PA3]MUL42921.1 hypothetical protein [Streptomonospora sp. PA3]
MNDRPVHTLAARACQEGADQWVPCGNTILGWVMGLGAAIAVIALLIIAGKMVQANFTGDPWIAARGMGELPWVLLGIVLLMVAAPIIALLLQGGGAEGGDGQTRWVEYTREQAPDPPGNGGDGGSGDGNGGDDGGGGGEDVRV